MKFALRVLLNALIWLLCWTAAAEAGPIAAAIGAIAAGIKGILAAGGIGAMLLKAAVGLALNVGFTLLQRAMQDKPEEPGVHGQMRVGGDRPLTFIIGYYATPGDLEYVGTYGQPASVPNAGLVQVISLGDLPASDLVGVLVNGERCTLLKGEAHPDLGWPVQEYRSGAEDHLWIKFHDGTQSAADPFLLATFGADPERPWEADMIGRGVPYVIATARLDRKKFTGPPTFLFELHGIKLYDIRKDTTAGGSGAHRWENPATWEFSQNPVVMAYNIARGIRYEGEWVYGGQNWPAFRLPASSWIAAANECDALVDLEDGETTEPQFRAGMEVICDREPLGVIEALLKACNGRMAEIGGIYKVHVGAPALPVYSFTDEDIVVTDGQTLDPFPGLESTHNGMHASYPEPAEAWEMKDAPPRYNAAYEAADDGRRLIASARLTAVPYGSQVQRLMAPMIEEQRRFRKHVITLPPEAWLLEPAIDTVSWTSARNGYVDKKFVIEAMDGQPGMNQMVVLREIDPADYDFGSGDYLPAPVGPIGPIIPPPQPIVGWQVFPAEIEDAAGNARRPSILVSFDGNQPDVRAVRVQVRLAASGVVVFDGEVPYGDPAPGAKQNILAGTFLPLTNYEVRGLFVPFSGRETEWSAWLAVTTPDVRLGAADLYPIDLGQLGQDIEDLLAWSSGQRAREILDEIRGLAAFAASQDLANFADKQTLRRELRSELDTTEGKITAAYSEAITVATGPGSALVLRIEELEATVPGLATVSALDALTVRVTTAEGTIVSQGSAITAIQNELPNKASASAVSALDTRVTEVEGEITSVAEALTSVSAATEPGDVATANFRMTASAGPAGYAARIGMEARAGGSGAYRSASLFLDVPNSTGAPTRVVALADQFIVTDGSNNAQPFLFTGGVGYLNAIKVNFADVQNVLIGTAQIANAAITGPKCMPLQVGRLAA